MTKQTKDFLDMQVGLLAFSFFLSVVVLQVCYMVALVLGYGARDWTGRTIAYSGFLELAALIAYLVYRRVRRDR